MNNEILPAHSNNFKKRYLSGVTKIGLAAIIIFIVCVILVKFFLSLAPILLQVSVMAFVGLGIWAVFHRLSSVEKKLESQAKLLRDIQARITGPTDPPRLR